MLIPHTGHRTSNFVTFVRDIRMRTKMEIHTLTLQKFPNVQSTSWRN